MSMHQPWASLLIAGIKKHEGRSWYTSHRGRLWIASTAKPVDPEEVKMMEKFYRAHYNGQYKKIPTIFQNQNSLNSYRLYSFVQIIQLNFQSSIQQQYYWDVF